MADGLRDVVLDRDIPGFRGVDIGWSNGAKQNTETMPALNNRAHHERARTASMSPVTFLEQQLASASHVHR